MTFETFAVRFRKAMEYRKMKQVDIVEKTGINKAIISSYLKGSYEPKQTNLYLISKALDVNPGYLLGYDVSMDPKTNELLTEINSKINNLSVQQLEKLNILIDTMFIND